MSEIKKLLMADYGGTEMRIKRMELLWEMNTKMNLIGDEKNQKTSDGILSGLLHDMGGHGEQYES